MGTAKIVSLRARPSQISHLCFDNDGILGELTTHLGATTVGFDFPKFYAELAAAPTLAGNPSRLKYDFLAIQQEAQPSTLASLRAEPRKAALDKAINARQNAFFSKYANISAIVSRINAWYAPATVGSKPNRLAILSSLAEDQAAALKAAYTSDGLLGVVKHTHSILGSTTITKGHSNELGSSSQSGSTTEEGFNMGVVSGTIQGPPPDGQILPWNVNHPVGMVLNDATSGETGSNKSFTHNWEKAVEKQGIVNTDYGYRMPYFESQAQNERAQISLIDQQFSQFMYSQQLPNLTQIFANELRSMDGDVYRLQIAFLSSLLMSPFRATVTGIYKHPGESVRGGEPVIRVENNAIVQLVGTLVYRDPITLGATVTVQTSLFDAASNPTTITGKVVAARGHSAEDDQWEVVVACDNVGAGGADIVPINYGFDFDDTVVTIS